MYTHAVVCEGSPWAGAQGGGGGGGGEGVVHPPISLSHLDYLW